jgi:ankyrin repeat protein
MERIVRLALAILIGAAQIGLAAAQTVAQAESDENPFICGALREAIREQDRTLEGPRLNIRMFEAADKGCTSIVADLLDRGAWIEARDRFANTVLIRAAAAGHEDLVALLLERGADIVHHNLNGATALLRAVQDDHRAVAEVLLEHGASLKLVSRSGVMPLAAAAFNGSARMVDLLLEHGAEPAEADGTGKGPILYAAARGFDAIVARLLDAGADPNQTFAHDLTALMWAAGHANDVPEPEGLATVQLLVRRGARLDPVDDRGRSAVMIAAERGHSLIVSWMVGAGADTGLEDNEGKTAADLAASPAALAALGASAPN